MHNKFEKGVLVATVYSITDLLVTSNYNIITGEPTNIHEFFGLGKINLVTLAEIVTGVSYSKVLNKARKRRREEALEKAKQIQAKYDNLKDRLNK